MNTFLHHRAESFLSSQPVCSYSRNSPHFMELRMSITVFTSAPHLSLLWASWIQSKLPHPTSWTFILILSSHLRLGLPSGLFPSGFPTKTLYTPLFSPIRPHVAFSLLRSYRSVSPGPRQVFVSRSKASFYGDELSATLPTPRLKDYPLSAIRDCSFNMFAAVLHIGGRSSMRHLRTRLAVTGARSSRTLKTHVQQLT